MDLLKSYPVVIEIPVQWGDQDAIGHVNNVVYFRWWESSRVAYTDRIQLITARRNGRISTVLASIHCDFREQLMFPDTVLIGARLGRVGNSSIRIEHCLVSKQQAAVAAEATSTIVAFDFETNRSCPVPVDVRQAMRNLEPHRVIEGLD